MNHRKPCQSCAGIKWGCRWVSATVKGMSDLQHGHLAAPFNRPVWRLRCTGEGVRAVTCVLHRYQELWEAPSGRPQWPVSGRHGCRLIALHLGGRGGRELAGSLAPPFTAVAQQCLQSPALQSTDGVCSTLPHLPTYLSTAPYLCLLISFVLFSNTVPLTGIVRGHPDSWLGCVKLLEEFPFMKKEDFGNA